MGLEDIALKVGNVSSRKEIENHTISEHDWKYLLLHEPHWAEMFASQDSEEEIKMWIETLDEILEDGVRGVHMSPSEETEILEVRKHLIDKL